MPYHEPTLLDEIGRMAIQARAGGKATPTAEPALNAPPQSTGAASSLNGVTPLLHMPNVLPRRAVHWPNVSIAMGLGATRDITTGS